MSTTGFLPRLPQLQRRGLGFLPGLGLLVAFALALPFVVGMEPVTAIAFLLAMYAQATIAGDLTAIAFAVPGTPGSGQPVPVPRPPLYSLNPRAGLRDVGLGQRVDALDSEVAELAEVG